MGTRLKSVLFQKVISFKDARGKRHGGDHLDAEDGDFAIESHEDSQLVTITQDNRLVFRVHYSNVAGETPDGESLGDKVYQHTGLSARHQQEQAALAKVEREKREQREAEELEAERPKPDAPAPKPSTNDTPAARTVDRMEQQIALAPTPVELTEHPADAVESPPVDDEDDAALPAPPPKKKGKGR